MALHRRCSYAQPLVGALILDNGTSRHDAASNSTWTTESTLSVQTPYPQVTTGSATVHSNATSTDTVPRSLLPFKKRKASVALSVTYAPKVCGVDLRHYGIKQRRRDRYHRQSSESIPEGASRTRSLVTDICASLLVRTQPVGECLLVYQPAGRLLPPL
jgi:hypothetical protein